MGEDALVNYFDQLTYSGELRGRDLDASWACLQDQVGQSNRECEDRKVCLGFFRYKFFDGLKPKGRFGPASQGWVKAFSFPRLLSSPQQP